MADSGVTEGMEDVLEEIGADMGIATDNQELLSFEPINRLEAAENYGIDPFPHVEFVCPTIIVPLVMALIT
jgi:hypothetical protein